MYTVEIQAGSDERGVWQALAPAEQTAGLAGETANDIAQATAINQTIADGDGWRVCVWEGVDTGAAPAAIVTADEVA